MTVDTTKHIYSSYMHVDIELHCLCGEYIQINDEDVTKRCPDCNKLWQVKVTALEIQDD
jgi:hypothetical protein